MIGALALMLPLVLLGLQGLAITPWWWTERPLTEVRADSGKRFAVPLGTTWMSRYQVAETPAIVLEDGVPLACGNMPPEAIAEFGAGRYTLADGNAYLSASDNSDPRTNGRRYTLRWPSLPPIFPVTVWLALSTLMAGAGVVVLAWTFRAALLHVVRAPSFVLCAAIFLLPFVAHRAWYLIDVPIPGVQPDSYTYYEPAKALIEGSLPHFEVRPPMFPLLLAGVLSTTHSLAAVTFTQTLIAAAGGLVLIYGVFRLCRPASLWVAIAMAAAATGFWPLEQDTSALSESLFASGILFSFGFLALALASDSKWAFAAASASMAAVICTRPAGLYLVVIYALAVIYLWRTRRRTVMMAFASPFPVVLLMLAFYNALVVSSFTPTAWAEANMAVATLTFWEHNANYPEAVNARIDTAVRAVGLTDAERIRREDTWSPDVLAPIFLKGFNARALDEVTAIGGDYRSARPWLRRISLDAIAAHPRIYLKFVATMAYRYYVGNIAWRADFGDYIKGRALTLLTADGQRELQRDPERNELVLRYFDASRPVALRIADACAPAGVGAIDPTPARRMYRVVQRARDLIFAQTAFVALFAFALMLAMVRLVGTGGHHDVAFMMVMLGFSVIGSGLLVCLVEYAGHRYSYPTEFAVYVVPAMTPWLLRNR